MNDDPISIIIPWTPPSDSLPNRTRNRHAVARIRGEIREEVGLHITSLLSQNLWMYDHLPFEGETACRVTIHWGKQRSKGSTSVVRWRQVADADNLIAAMKGAFDALEDTRVIVNDRDLAHYPLKQERDPSGQGYTVFEMWSVSDG